MNDEDFKAYLEEQGYHHVRKLPDGWVGIWPLMFTHALCTELDMSGYNRRYCYKHIDDCEREIEKMQSVGDVPDGWIRRIPEPFFFTIVGRGDHAHIGSLMTEREIVSAAIVQAPFPKPSHLWEITPSIDEALKHLNGEGRIFEIFDVGTEWRGFLVRAETLGLREDAVSVAESVMSRWHGLELRGDEHAD